MSITPKFSVFENTETADEYFNDCLGVHPDPTLRGCSGTLVVRPAGKDWCVANFGHEKRTAWTRSRVIILRRRAASRLTAAVPDEVRR
jgi:hypothetical protein